MRTLFTSFRSQLILILSLTLLTVFAFGFYVYTTTRGLEQITHKQEVTLFDIRALEASVHAISQASFLFIGLTVVLILSSLIYIVVTVTFSLNAILHGIREIDGGNLDYKIPPLGRHEFGSISQFLNSATTHLAEEHKQLLAAKTNIAQQVGERTKELQAERNKLAIVLAGMSDSVIALDLQRNIVLFNKNAELLTGFTTEQVLGKNIGQTIEFFDNNRSIPVNTYAPVKAEGFEGVVYQKENTKMVSACYKQAWVKLTVSQIREGKEINLGNILTMHDHTKEQELEEMKLDFVSIAAHELRTPLTSIKGYLSVFLNESKEKLSSDQQLLLDRIAISANQLSALVENILSVSRIERGTYTISAEIIEWIPFVERAVNEVKLRAKEKKVHLTFIKPQQASLKVNVDKLRIVEVLYNLLANAIEYTQEEGEIAVWVERVGENVITHVKDTGKGIPKDALPHLFTKFFRVSGKLSNGSKGTGLGLYISKAIVELHNGTIWVDSEQGVGSTFSFSLPLTQE